MVKVKFKLIAVYEDNSSEPLEEFDTYEAAEEYLQTTTYEATEFRIEKVFIKSNKPSQAVRGTSA